MHCEQQARDSAAVARRAASLLAAQACQSRATCCLSQPAVASRWPFPNPPPPNPPPPPPAPFLERCTAPSQVTRPGLAPIAAAHAVELLVNMAHHPARALAPAAVRSADACAPAPAEAGVGTGPVPHQLRGFMATFSTMQLEAAASTVCTACSANVVGALDARGDAFIRAAIEDPDLLERASGLEAMKAEADALAEAAGGDDWAMDEDF